MFPRELTGRERRIRVARVITRLNVGGPAIQAMLLTRRLDPARFATLLVTGVPGPFEGNMAWLRPEPGVVPVVLSRMRREISPIDDFLALLGLVHVLRSFRPHIVHTHLSKAGLLGRVAARLAGVPVVVHTFHGNVLGGYFGGIRSRLVVRIERALARASTRLVAISPTQGRELRDFRIADERKIVQIPLGLELEPFLRGRPGHLRGELGADGRPLVGLVARLVPIKRVDVFLDAAALIASEYPEAVFVVVGDGELHDRLLARRDSLGLQDRAHFLGWRSDLADIYADLDVVALSSDNEGTPVSVIEALTAGRAVVATNVGGVGDVLGDDAGVLVPRGDPHALARGIGQLLRDPSRRAQLGARGRQKVYPAYDITTLRDRISALYIELLEGSER